MNYDLEIRGKVLKKYFYIRKYIPIRKINVSPQILIQASRKFHGIHNFWSSIRWDENQLKILLNKKFRNFIADNTVKRPVTCESHSSVETDQNAIKILGYIQLHLLYNLVKKIMRSGGSVPP
jgi:hypothetical protein